MEQQVLEEALGVARIDTLVRQETGTYDFASGPEQMRAVHWALTVYFETGDWLEERRRQQPAIG